MFKVSIISSVIIFSFSIFVISNELLAATPQASEPGKMDSKMPAEKKANNLQVQFKSDKFTIESHDSTLGELLKSVTERTGVIFNIAEEIAKQDRLSLKLSNTPSSEAIKTILTGYNTLYVWDEHMKLLQVNVLGRVATDTAYSETVTKESITAKNDVKSKLHPKSSSPRDPARIESALKAIDSDHPEQREAALDDLIGDDDPRIATAMLDVALNAAETNHKTAGGKATNDLSSKAAFSLWRHGLERGFADQETIDALKTLEAHGNAATSGLAKQALQDLNKHF